MLKAFFSACAIILSLILTIMPAQAAAPIAQIQAMLVKPNIMCGRFDQTKQLTGIKKPLTSTGRFCVVANKGVLWRTLQPFPNTLRLTQNEIIQVQDNRTSMRLDAKQEPVVRMINSVLFSLLAGDLSQLDKVFALNGSVQHNQWTVTLKARAPELAKAIGDISLTGGKHVEQVTMIEPNGDRTHIIFSDIKSGNAAMTAAEGALFEKKYT